jgi:2-amino-4-hydroxy-6-hydroxymethyldihydropteridine diphosphokinase
MLVYLGLGANLSQPVEQLDQAINALSLHPMITVVKASSYYRSAPMGPQDQPDYINAVVECHTDLSPLALLDVCQSIEQAQFRERKRHWGERTLDIDLLSMGDCVTQTERLTLPHPGIQYRDFVMLPWREIAPNYHIPTIGLVSELPILADYQAQPIVTSSEEFA